MEYTIEIVGEETMKLHQQLYAIVMKPARIGLAVATGLMMVSCLSLGMESGLSSDYASAVGYLVGCLASITMPYWMGQLTYRKKMKYFDGKIPQSVARFGDEIHLISAESTIKIPYYKLKKIVVAKDCVVLRTIENGAVAIPKGPFTEGSLQDLLALLKEKCPLLKLPDWQ